MMSSSHLELQALDPSVSMLWYLDTTLSITFVQRTYSLRVAVASISGYSHRRSESDLIIMKQFGDYLTALKTALATYAPTLLTLLPNHLLIKF